MSGYSIAQASAPSEHSLVRPLEYQNEFGEEHAQPAMGRAYDNAPLNIPKIPERHPTRSQAQRSEHRSRARTAREPSPPPEPLPLAAPQPARAAGPRYRPVSNAYHHDRLLPLYLQPDPPARSNPPQQPAASRGRIARVWRDDHVQRWAIGLGGIALGAILVTVGIAANRALQQADDSGSRRRSLAATSGAASLTVSAAALFALGGALTLLL